MSTAVTLENGFPTIGRLWVESTVGFQALEKSGMLFSNVWKPTVFADEQGGDEAAGWFKLTAASYYYQPKGPGWCRVGQDPEGEDS